MPQLPSTEQVPTTWVGPSRGVQEELVQKKKGPEGVGGTEQ